MIQIDIISGYAVCSVGSLVGAALLRLAETDDAATRRGLRTYGTGLVLMGLAVLPSLLGAQVVAHPAAQFSLSFGSIAGLLMVAQGLTQLQGGHLRPGPLLAAMLLAGAGLLAAMAQGPLVLGRSYPVLLALASSLCAWSTWRLSVSPRDLTERLLGLAILALAASTWLRAGLALTYDGPARGDLMYAPAPMVATYGLMYSVLPTIVTSLLLNLVNARLRRALHQRASTDELTGAMSRRALRELAPALISQARTGGAVATMMIDLDHFKRINDEQGHGTGDAVLAQVAALLRNQLRAEAMLGRYGGEEFVAVVPVDVPAVAPRVAERLREAVERHPWRSATGAPLVVTISLGMALAGPLDDLDATLRRADRALYRAKGGGRNRCVLDGEAGPASAPAAPLAA
jgi:diguanylate cyclase (GGDEF)-like protein